LVGLELDKNKMYQGLGQNPISFDKSSEILADNSHKNRFALSQKDS